MSRPLKHPSELSSATFCTFLRELSPPRSHRFLRRRVPVCSNGSRGGNACRFLASPVFPDRSGDNGYHFCSRRSESLLHGFQLRLAAGRLQASQSRFRFASARAWRAFCRAASSASGMSAPVMKYISSGVCPRNAECGNWLLCCST